MDFSGFGGGANDFEQNDCNDGANDHADDNASQVLSGLDFSLLDANNEFSSSNNGSNNEDEDLADSIASK